MIRIYLYIIVYVLFHTSAYTQSDTNLDVEGTPVPGRSAAARVELPVYLVTDIPAPEGSFTYNPTSINEAGHVVGWAQYSDSPTLRAWIWTPENGLVVLPTPPGETHYRATGINDSGVIAGDGGFDGGTAWRYENGEFTMLGTLPDYPITNAEGINNAKEIAGTAKDYSVLTPDRAYIYTDSSGLINITPDFGARGTGINNSAQVCGYSQSNNAFRWSEDDGVQFLPAPEGLPYTFAFAINDSGQVVGEAKSLNGNTARAFIYSDDTGMQTLPHLAAQLNQALGVNNYGQVVGYSDPPGSLVGWLWSAESGLLQLNDLIDPAENLNIIRALDINDSGQIVAKGTDTAVGGQRLVILTTSESLLPDKVVLAYPPDQSTIEVPDNEVAVELRWYASQPAVTYYHLNIARDVNFTDIVFTSDEITDTFYVFTGVEEYESYYWRVRAENETGEGPYSDIWTFTTIIVGTGSELGIPREYSLMQNYPNPFNPSTRIRYGLPERSSVKVEIYNTLGQRVVVLVNTELEAGYHDVEWYAGRLVSGMYFYRLEAVPVNNQSNRIVEVKSMLLLK